MATAEYTQSGSMTHSMQRFAASGGLFSAVNSVHDPNDDTRAADAPTRKLSQSRSWQAFVSNIGPDSSAHRHGPRTKEWA